MTIKKNALDYLADMSGYPIWIFDGKKALLYSSIDTEKLLDDDLPVSFFGHFCSENDKPQIRRLDSGELYAFFGLDAAEGRLIVVAGPAYEIHPYTKQKTKGLSLSYLLKSEYIKPVLLKMPTTTVYEFCRFISALAELATGRECPVNKLSENVAEYSLSVLVNKKLTEIIFDNREEERATVYAPELEKKILSYVTSGDVESLRNFRMPSVKDPNTEGNNYQSLFEAVSIVALATRAAIDGGLDYVAAYSLSDLYLKRLGSGVSETQISAIMSQVLVNFAQKVRDEGRMGDKRTLYSPYIVRSMQYIRAHLHYPISLEDVAEELNINPKYLSRLFVNNLGEKFSSFVQHERILEAKNLLESTDRSIADISNSLGFSSQSYFIKVFQRYIGITPGQFIEQRKLRGALLP